jgi:hypothetical protein
MKSSRVLVALTVMLTVSTIGMGWSDNFTGGFQQTWNWQGTGGTGYSYTHSVSGGKLILQDSSGSGTPINATQGGYPALEWGTGGTGVAMGTVNQTFTPSDANPLVAGAVFLNVGNISDQYTNDSTNRQLVFTDGTNLFGISIDCNSPSMDVMGAEWNGSVWSWNNGFSWGPSSAGPYRDQLSDYPSTRDHNLLFGNPATTQTNLYVQMKITNSSYVNAKLFSYDAATGKIGALISELNNPFNGLISSGKVGIVALNNPHAGVVGMDSRGLGYSGSGAQSPVYGQYDNVFATNKAGDVNGDGSVTVSDISPLAASYGDSTSAWPMGDLNNDGLVNFTDLNIVLEKSENLTAIPRAGSTVSVQLVPTKIDATTYDIGIWVKSEIPNVVDVGGVKAIDITLSTTNTTGKAAPMETGSGSPKSIVTTWSPRVLTAGYVTKIDAKARDLNADGDLDAANMTIGGINDTISDYWIGRTSGGATPEWTLVATQRWVYTGPGQVTIQSDIATGTMPSFFDYVPGTYTSVVNGSCVIGEAEFTGWTDDFNTLDTSRWQVVTSTNALTGALFGCGSYFTANTPAARNITVAGGQMALPINAGDTYQGDNDYSNVVITPAPTGWKTITVHLKGATAFDDPSGWNQFNILLWNDQDNHVKFGFNTNDSDPINSGSLAGHITVGCGIETSTETGAKRWFLYGTVNDAFDNSNDMTLRVQKNTDGTYKYSAAVGTGPMVVYEASVAFESADHVGQTPAYIGVYAGAGRSTDTLNWWPYDPNANRSVDVLVDSIEVSPDLPEAIPGDVNMDGLVDGYDIDAVFDAANAGSTDLKYDLDGSGTVDTADAEYLIYTILHSEYGDADLSGTADAGDYDYWFFGLENGIQPDMSRWTVGDFDGSGTVDAGDYDYWFFGLEN